MVDLLDQLHVALPDASSIVGGGISVAGLAFIGWAAVVLICDVRPFRH